MWRAKKRKFYYISKFEGIYFYVWFEKRSQIKRAIPMHHHACANHLGCISFSKFNLLCYLKLPKYLKCTSLYNFLLYPFCSYFNEDQCIVYYICLSFDWADDKWTCNNRLRDRCSAFLRSSDGQVSKSKEMRKTESTLCIEWQIFHLRISRLFYRWWSWPESTFGMGRGGSHSRTGFGGSLGDILGGWIMISSLVVCHPNSRQVLPNKACCVTVQHHY